MKGIIGKFEGIPIRLCKCGTSPTIYEEGVARRYLTGEDQNIYFSQSDGYFVECDECGEGEYARTLKAAIENWNKKMEVPNETITKN